MRIEHMLEMGETPVQFVHGRTRSDLDTDPMLRLALTRAMEIIGEAATKVSPAARATLPGVPWPQIVAMRNRLVHAYADVDRDVLWRTATEEVPLLLQQLQDEQL